MKADLKVTFLGTFVKILTLSTDSMIDVLKGVWQMEIKQGFPSLLMYLSSGIIIAIRQSWNFGFVVFLPFQNLDLNMKF